MTIQDFKLPSYNEIPNVGLYLEQTAKFLGEYLDSFSSFSITSSMISNYVKKKMVSNPVKKQYNREQIAGLMLIAIEKSVLSLEDIQTLSEMQREVWDIRESYEYFCGELMKALQQISAADEKIHDSSNTESESVGRDKVVPFLIKNIAVTIAHKMYVDQFFANGKAADR